ncbi:MAG: IS481 family transposase [Deltaproteobacteria bacterium]|nr:MAG: IS481 family transposase [Deltaproteobacteria bacterium]
MPWAETEPMKERARFVAEVERGHYTMTELCQRFGISRKTGYKILDRWEAEGPAGLADRSRAPHRCPHRIEPGVARAIVEARRKHPSWGPRKLLAWLGERRPELALPAASTAGDLLKRRGLVKKRRRRRTWKHPGAPELETKAPNDVWTADFKGHFRTKDGVYCYPLTIADQHTRYLLRCQALGSVRTEEAKPVFRRLFGEVGLPRAIRSDNGAPFASTGIHGLCEMNVWWMRLGIAHQRIRPASPQENGAHERMHRTLKQETTRPPGATLRGQQRKFDRFREQYNHERPHEAQGNRPPAKAWRPSPREYPNKIRPPEYPGHHLVRLVSNAGTFRFNVRQIFLSNALAQEHIGLEEIDDGVWGIYFYDVRLGTLDERDCRIYA